MQAAEVARVKRYASGVLRYPVVITPQHTVAGGAGPVPSAGHSGFPVPRCRQGGGHRHRPRPALRDALRVPVSQIMTPREKLITVAEGTTSPKPRRC